MKVLQYIATSSNVLKTFLYDKGISRKSLSAIKQNGALLVNKEYVTVRKIIQEGDEVTVYLPNETPSPNLEPVEMDLKILYEDEWFIIVSKSAMMNTAPSREHRHNSLVEAVLYYMIQNGEQTIPHIVTRLDRGTSGIVIFAKHQLLHHMISETTVNKYYLAVVHGVVKQKYGKIEAPIARAKHSIIEREVSPDGKFAHTEYEYLSDDSQNSMLKLQLFTGRTHQIRVHLAHIGHPIVGDSLYGYKTKGIGHQLLQCYNVEFEHPITKNKINIIDEMHYNLVGIDML
ncbi:MAG TPA: RluA family pseudouridine synthase [Staphylococcus sp.]|uniref:RluA family pseudouridine synthase n=1 Tax=Mammaliicoccus vitulinus TaxID=71237 RepID=UPI000EC237CE|nr:RluA family pseudouridine synthase [Mammaliicoccus vitulinus]HAL10428.1 RluA family pseudouridine synthase [Staphylococcus sp.]